MNLFEILFVVGLVWSAKWLIDNECRRRANRDNLRFYYRRDE